MNTNGPPERAYIHLDPESQKWIDARTAWILQEFGSEHVRSCEITHPNSALLNQYRGGTDEEVIQYFGCVARAMGLDAERIDFVLGRELKTDDGSQALGLYQAIDDRFIIWVDESQLGEPPELLATLVHELCHVQLMGYGRLSGSEPDNEPLTDLLAVFFGYGIILANSVVYEQTLRLGEFYQNQIGRRGYLTMPMFGYAMALLARLRGEDGSEWKRHMRLDVRDAFSKTQRFFDRHGMPDLSAVPAGFSPPRITLEPADDLATLPNRKPPFYPADYEAEEPEDEREFVVTATEPDEPDGESEFTCIYCRAPVDSDQQESVCRACQESIDEGERESKELREIDEKNQRFLRWFFFRALACIAAFIAMMLLLSLLFGIANGN